MVRDGMKEGVLMLSSKWLEDTVFVTLFEGGNWYDTHFPETIAADIRNPHDSIFAAIRRGRIIFDLEIARNLPELCPWRFAEGLYTVDTTKKEN